MVSFTDLWQESGLIRSKYAAREDLVKRMHRRAHGKLKPQLDEAVRGGYELTPGLKQAMKLPLEHSQLSHRYPWIVVWFDDKGKRRGKLFAFLVHAILCHRIMLQRYPTATVVSRVRGYDVPNHYRGRLPKPWKWCPFCMKPRKYRPALDSEGNRQTFYATVKVASANGGYERRDRKLLLMECPVCKQNNRHYIFRRANQPWELIKVPSTRRRYRRRK